MNWIQKIAANIFLKILRKRARGKIVDVITYLINKVCKDGKDKAVVMNEVDKKLRGLK